MEYTNPLSNKSKSKTLNIDYVKTYLDDSLIDSFSSSSSSSYLTSGSSESTKHLNYSSDSLSSFEDYRLNQLQSDSYSPYYGSGLIGETSKTSTSFLYFRCAIPVSSSTCTTSFISSMCCNCGRG